MELVEGGGEDVYERPEVRVIHTVRRKMWEESKQNPHMLIENIKKEAKGFVEAY